MDDLDLLSQYDVPEDWEEGKDSWHGRLSVNHKERHVVDLESIGEVVDAGATLIGVRYDDHLMATVDEFLAMQ